MPVNEATYIMLGLTGGLAVLSLALALLNHAAHRRDRDKRD